MTQPTRSPYVYFGVGAVGTFMATLDGSIVNVALPEIARDFGLAIDDVAWVVLAYSLTLISLLLLFGAWVQRRGYRFGYLFGFSWVTIGSTVCSLAPSVEVLVVGRSVQAIGTAMFAAIGPGLVTTVFPENQRGKGLGLMVMMVSLGFVTGFPLGGFLTSIAHWSVIFWINIPIGLIGIFATTRVFRDFPLPEARSKMPLASGISVALGLVLTTVGITNIADFGLLALEVWLPFVAAAVAFASFGWLQKQPDQVLVGPGMTNNPRFLVSLGAATCQFMATSGVLVLMPFYLSEIRLLPQMQVGLYLLSIPLTMLVSAPLAGTLSDKLGVRGLSLTGMVVVIAALGLLSQLAVTTPGWYVITSFVVLGIGVGLFSTPNSSAIMGAVGEEDRAVSSGILATNRNLGMSFGVALATTLFGYLETRNAGLGSEAFVFLASYQPVLYTAIGLALVGLVLVALRPAAR